MNVEAQSRSVTVAPLVGAWIEIKSRAYHTPNTDAVAPLVGAWIEITLSRRESNFVMSLLSWERGLKYKSLDSLF